MSSTDAPNDNITPAEAAKIVGCCKDTILRYITDGALAATRPLGYGRGKPVIIRRADVVKLKADLEIVSGPGRKIASLRDLAAK